jgi:aminomethyltransferase
LSDTAALKTTPLTAAHRAAGARMVEFGGYDMPVQYADGVMKEHLWTRSHAGLFDVSHMGPSFLRLKSPTGEPKVDHAAICTLLEPLVCGDLRGLKRGQLRYTLLLNAHGGIVDDLMVGRPVADDEQGVLQIVVNAGTKEGDFARIAAAAGDTAALVRADDRGLIAVQGPDAEAVTAAVIPEAAALSFMTLTPAMYEGEQIVISRSGYTGEDGYEILVRAEGARKLWDRLVQDDRTRPIGLGARDSLRLEAGLPLYGHDLDETVSPVEASLEFALSKRRREAEDFPGAARALGEVAGPAGAAPRRPARAGRRAGPRGR